MWDDLANWASIMGLLPAVWSEQSQSWLFLLVLLPVIPVSRWAWRRWTQQGVRVETTITRGPTSRELGFTEDAIEITVMNEGDHKIKIRDVRLMFYGEYGVSVAAGGPPGRCHSKLPMDVDTGAEENWYIPADQLANLLGSLHRPPSTTVSTSRNVKLYARCISGTGKVYRSRCFRFPVGYRTHVF